MRYLTLAIVLCAFAQNAAHAENLIDVLLKGSDLVVVGRMKEASSAIALSDQIQYIGKYDVTEVLKGDPVLAKKQIRILVNQPDRDRRYHHPLLAADSESILFLQHERGNPEWRTIDAFLGLQRPTPQLIDQLKEHAKYLKETSGD